MPTVTPECSIRFTKGCKALGIAKDDIATVLEVREMGADYGHFVRLTVKVVGGKTHALWVRHKNRLSDDTVRAHNGDPTKNVEFFVRPAKRIAPLADRMVARARSSFGSLKVTFV